MDPNPTKKGTGFVQPLRAHEHWYIDVAYLNLGGTFYYLCSILDGASRAIIHWEIREAMTETDVEWILLRAREQHPDARPRVISDNGPQFIAKDFKEFIRLTGMTHVRTSPPDVALRNAHPYDEERSDPMAPRPQAYDFEHIVLRDAALEDPIMFLWASRLPDAARKLQNIWRRCAGDGPSIAGDDLTVWVDVRAPLYTVVVSLPAPAAVSECHFVAALISLPTELVEKLDREQQGVPARDALDRALKVLVATTDHHERATWAVPTLFFTLERGEDPDGAPRTVLGQWMRRDDGEYRHLNFGDGPRPDRDAFLDAVAGIIRQTVAPADA